MDITQAIMASRGDEQPTNGWNRTLALQPQAGWGSIGDELHDRLLALSRFELRRESAPPQTGGVAWRMRYHRHPSQRQNREVRWTRNIPR